MGEFGPWKRIRILDDVLLIFGGRSGFDSKIIVKPLHEKHHYTLSMRHGSDWLSQPKIPIDLHKTYEGQKKEYESMGKGSFDLKMLMDRILKNPRPEIREVDLRAPEWRKHEVVTLDERLLNLMTKKELNVTEDFAERLSPLPISRLQASEFGVGMLTGRKAPGMLVKAAERAFALGLPGLKGLDQRIEEALDFDSFIDESYESDEYDEAGKEGQDEI